MHSWQPNHLLTLQLHISIRKQFQYHPKFHLKPTMPALITKSRFHFVFYLSDSTSWHLLSLVLNLNFYGSRLQFKSIYGKWARSQITFQLLSCCQGYVVICHWPGFLVPCFYSEELCKTPSKIPGAITVFSQCYRRKEGQPKSLQRQILFGLAFFSQFVTANIPVTHEIAALDPQREWRKFKV